MIAILPEMEKNPK